MTATAVVMAPARRARWTGYAWMVWRQYRAAILGVLTLFGLAALLLLLSGLPMHSTYRDLGLPACQDLTKPTCQGLELQFEAEWYSWALYLPRLLEFLPALVGAFVGGPLLAREYESGTFRFAWTQGTGRARWVLVRLAGLGVGVTVLALAYSQLFTWWFAPFMRSQGRLVSGQAFEVVGIVFAARTLFAFCLGVFVGAVIRRAIAATVLALVGWFAMVVPTVVLWRQHYLPAITIQDTTVVAKPGPQIDFSQNWMLASWITDPAGHRLTRAELNQVVSQVLTQGHDPRSWLPTHGYTNWTQYQPANRFWPFQFIESGVLVAISLALVLTTVWLVKRR